MDMEKTKQELRDAQIKNERSSQSQRVHEAELQRLEQEVEAWKDKYRQSEQDVITAEDNVQKAEDENKRLKYAIQEQDATKERLISAGADYERQEEQYNAEIDRLQEKLNKVQYAEEQARVEKERSELDVMKLERELEKLQYQMELLEERSASRIGDRRDGSSDRPRSRGSERAGAGAVDQDRGERPRSRGADLSGPDGEKLELVYSKLDRANLELKTLSEENERLEVESRKFKNQLEHSRTLLDSAFENEAKCKSETEAAKREVLRLSDKLEQAEAELRHIRMEKDKYQNEYTRKVEHVGGDFDKLTLEISQLTTERDQLVG